MKQWNAHAWYITGILLALLVGVLSVEWSSVPRLPEILSFAVGFSSLLLAIFTIIQSMTSTGDATAALASVREVASGMRDTTTDVQSAALDVRAIAAGLLETSEANRAAISQLASELKSKAQSSGATESDLLPNGVSLGSGPAFLAAILSYQTKHPIRFSLVFPNDKNTTYEHGVIGGLESAGVLRYTYINGAFSILDVKGDLDAIASAIRDYDLFANEAAQKRYVLRIAAVDKYFTEPDDKGIDSIADSSLPPPEDGTARDD